MKKLGGELPNRSCGFNLAQYFYLNVKSTYDNNLRSHLLMFSLVKM